MATPNGFIELDRYGIRSMEWAHEVLGVGEKSLTFNNESAVSWNFYFDPDTGKSLENGGKGTQTEPFSHPIDFIDFITKYKINKYEEFKLYGQQKIYRIDEEKVLHFRLYKALSLYYFNFDIYDIGSNSPYPIVFNMTFFLVLKIGNIRLYNGVNPNNPYLSISQDAIINVGSASHLVLLNYDSTCRLNVTNFSSEYYTSVLRIQHSYGRFYSTSLNIVSADGTSGNAPGKYGLYLIDGSSIISYQNSHHIDARNYQYRIERSKYINLSLDNTTGVYGNGQLYTLNPVFITENPSTIF